MLFAIFFVKCSNNLFAFKITNKICPWNNIFTFCNNKTLFRPIRNLGFCKNIFIFSYSNNITNFKFRIFIINCFIKVNMYACLYINKLHFNCSMICNVVLQTISSNLLIYTLLDIEFTYLQILFCKVLINISATTDFP